MRHPRWDLAHGLIATNLRSLQSVCHRGTFFECEWVPGHLADGTRDDGAAQGVV